MNLIVNDSKKSNMISINIDGKNLNVEAGTNIIQAASQLNIEIPHYCYHSKLSISGNCRMCLIEIGNPLKNQEDKNFILNNNNKKNIIWNPKPAIACATQAVENLHIKTKSSLINECRKSVMEFLLVNHPLDCPICDQAGECTLQEYAADYGRGYSRFIEKKNIKPKQTKIGPRVILDDERCILCSRCIRFCKEIINDDVLGFVDRGSYSTLTTYPGKKLENNYSLNTVDICPVGALTSIDFRFQMRVWFLKKTPSICTESSVGVNTYIWSREGKIYRITPRNNFYVNDSWMSDSGRELYKEVDSQKRIIAYSHNNNNLLLEEIVKKVSDNISTNSLAIIASGHTSIEEQFLLKQIANYTSAKVYFVPYTDKSDNFLISADRTPNTRGGLITKLISSLPNLDFSELISDIHSGKIKTLISYGQDITKINFSESLLKEICLIYMGTHENATSKIAKFIIPTLMVFEKSGSFVNRQFRLQKFEQAVPGPIGVFPDIHFLYKLLNTLKNICQTTPSLSNLWQEICNFIPIVNNVKYSIIPKEGYLLDKDKFKKINFLDDPSLQYSENI